MEKEINHVFTEADEKCFNNLERLFGEVGDLYEDIKKGISEMDFSCHMDK